MQHTTVVSFGESSQCRSLAGGRVLKHRDSVGAALEGVSREPGNKVHWRKAEHAQMNLSQHIFSSEDVHLDY